MRKSSFRETTGYTSLKNLRRQGRLRNRMEGLENRDMLSALPLPDHVVVVIEENHDYSQIIGSANAPYVNSLAQQGALMTDSTAVTHPSQPNYLDLFSGSNQGVTDDSLPPGLPFSTPNLGAELLANGLSFAGYSESMPYAGYTGTTYPLTGAQLYASRHNPWVDFTPQTPGGAVGANQMPQSVNQPLPSFPSDFSKLPTVSFIVPNVQDDMHDGTVQQADTWLKNHLDSYVQWAKTHNSLLVVTWDENDTSAGNHITTMFDGQMVQPGQYNESINHFNVLRTLEDLYSLPYAGQSANAAPITDIWSTTAPTASQKYVSAVYQDVLARGPDLGGLLYWSNLLDNGDPVSSVAEAIAHSDEYYANFVIKPDYLRLLNRAADDSGVQYWTKQMDNGLTDQELEAGFVASDEFFNNAGGRNVPWIDSIYQLLLGRPADSDGEQYWDGQLQAGQTREQVALRIAESAENNTQLINADYQHYLNRPADAGGLAYWLSQFAAGQTNEDVIAGFTGSDEYYEQHTV
ncbi:MAG TPA: DUF4214 domain-containing protein [Pirellulales bacterium]|nr:DUF4214 domain-containing protein [Pirellulales bacterium]